MQVFTHWPSPDVLPVPHDLTPQILSLLIEPFSNESDAASFWSAYGCCLIVIEAHDTFADFENLDAQLVRQIRHILDYPEYVESIGDNYQLFLTIINDEGTGLYLLTRSDNPLIKELLRG